MTLIILYGLAVCASAVRCTNHVLGDRWVKATIWFGIALVFGTTLSFMIWPVTR